MGKLLFAAVAASLMWASAASAMPAGPLASPADIVQVRTVCNQTGQCCATGSGQCFDFNRQSSDYYQPRRYAPPAYGYYRNRQVERRTYYGGRREDYDD